MPPKQFEIRAVWDDEASVWAVVESDIPGLAAEDETWEGLLSKLNQIVPELVKLNSHLIDWQVGPHVPVHIQAERSALLNGTN